MTILLLASCAVDASDEEATEEAEAVAEWCADQPEVTWESWGAGFIIQHCGPCHYGTETVYGAPYTFNSAAEVWAHQPEMIDVLNDRRMPPQGGPSEDDYELALAWMLCATPDS